MLKEGSLPHIFDALEHECETRNHQRHEVLKCACGIENIRPINCSASCQLLQLATNLLEISDADH